VNRDLVVSLDEIYFGEDGASRQAMGIVMDVFDGEGIGDGSGVESTLVPTRKPTVFLLGHEMEG
jgi:hypothetical protein